MVDDSLDSHEIIENVQLPEKMVDDSKIESSKDAIKEASPNFVPHVNVVICTPGHSLMGIYVKSLLATIDVLSQRGITWAYSNEFSSHVGDAREITLNGDMQNDIAEIRPFKGRFTYDKLMWIDSDIAWNPEDFLKLYEAKEDIVSGAYLLATGEVTAYPERLKPGYVYEQVLEMSELTEVQAIGFGFVCVKQGVFESLTRPWFQSTEVVWTDPDTDKKFPFMMMGEDMSWCERVMEKGYKIWFDPTVRVTHHKMMKLTWEGPKP